MKSTKEQPYEIREYVLNLDIHYLRDKTMRYMKSCRIYEIQLKDKSKDLIRAESMEYALTMKRAHVILANVQNL